MGLARLFVLLLATSAINSVWCHHHHHGVHPDSKKKRDQVELVRRYGSREEANAVSSVEDKNRRSLNINEVKEKIPYSDRRLEKMLEKAILKIITGELSTGDMLLLKSLNYSLEEVLAIRERELNKKKEEELSKKKESMKSWTKALYGQTVGKKGRYWDPNFVDHSSTVTRNPDYENTRNEGKKNRHADKSSYNDFDFDAYNRQAVLDYENLPSNLEFQQPWSEPTVLNLDENIKASSEEDNIHREFEKAMAPHVIFKIRYDDSEFDSSSGSDETSKNRSKTPKYRASTTLKTTTKNAGNSFHVVPPPTLSTAFPASVPLPVVSRLGSSNNVQTSYPRNVIHPNVAVSSTTTTASTTEKSIPEQVSNGEEKPNLIVRVSSPNEKTAVPETNEMSHENKKISPYEGLEWVEDDVYRVIPGLVDSLSYENSEDNETSDYEDFRHNTRQTWNTEENENDTLEYQNETPDPVKLFVANGNATTGHLPVANLSAYQEVARAHRREGNLTSSFDSQGEKAIEDIKTRVLALTGRFNNSSNANQVQRERLTMFSPSCQIPRNTDQETWADPFSMNMHFQLNLTSSDHVVAAKLRIYRLPQENLTSTTGSSFDEDEEDEKKIRISIYYYTKSLKKHRSKKRLLDSVVTPLTPEGTHLALDVIQGLRLWRLNPRNPHGNGNNHGLVIQVEDQDNRTLKPALYIQQPSCGDQDTDQKTSAYLHFSFEPVLVMFAS